MRFLLSTTSCLLVLSLNAQIIGLTVEVDTVFYDATEPNPSDPSVLLFEDLEGYVTYDVYANLTNETDKLISIYSDVQVLDVAPMFIDAPCGCFNPELGDVLLGGAQNTALLDLFPEMEYDTYWTLGLNQAEQSVISNLDYTSTTMCSESIADGLIFVYPDLAFEAGDDLRIKIARVTTCGSFSVSACFQVFIGGSNQNIQTWCIDENGSGPLLVGEVGTSGCTDPNADNYDAEASYSDGSCFYIVLGCTNSEACNYDAESNTDDGSCDYCFCLEGTTWDDSLQGCVIDAANLAANCGYGTFWDEESQTCLVVANCAEDLNEDGIIGVDDLMQLLSSYGTACEDFESDPESSEFTCGAPVNYQGYDYATVEIGDQCWFAENLRTLSYRNGDSIQGGFDNEQWAALTEPGQSVLNNLEANALFYGRFYNWFAANDERQLCPIDWHIPTHTEWNVLTDNLGGEEVTGGLLKSSPNDELQWNGTNDVGFNALPNGYRNNDDGEFMDLGETTIFWASTEAGASSWYRMLQSYTDWILSYSNGYFSNGFSVRCIKDTE
ncbi:MAG: hypothetical protein CMD33_08475 [Flavobacteriales bacterium]|nr:hypothetical protein [Flavobacteriales bacterium]